MNEPLPATASLPEFDDQTDHVLQLVEAFLMHNTDDLDRTVRRLHQLHIPPDRLRRVILLHHAHDKRLPDLQARLASLLANLNSR